MVLSPYENKRMVVSANSESKEWINIKPGH